MSEGHFRLEQQGHIVTITLNRPEKRNALTSATLMQLKGMAEALADNPEARVVIIRADRGTSHGTFAAVYAEARRAGIQHVQFATAKVN